MNSKKGGASSHLRPCKTAYCDKHNERKDEHPSNSNIRPEFSGNNSVWKDPDVPNLVTLDRQIRKDYFEAHGRHMPERGRSKASPLKESVTLMPNGGKETDEIQRRIVNRIEKEFHIRCVRMYNHRDEYCDETGEFNWHGHEVWDMYDHENHRMVALTRDNCRKWQDIVAQETGMPRGNPAYETRRKWLTANEYKIKKQNESIDKKKAEFEQMNAMVEQKTAEVETLKKQVREKEEKLAKAAKNPLSRMIAGVRTKMAGNYTPEEVSEMMAKAQAETDKAIAAAVQDAETCVRSLEAELAAARQALSDEKRKKELEIREAEQKAERKAVRETREAVSRDVQEYITRTKAELNGRVAKLQKELQGANEQIEKLKSSSYATTLITHALLLGLKDENVKGYKKDDMLAFLADHLDQNGWKVVSRILDGNGIARSLRTTAQLERARQIAATPSKPLPKKKGGLKM